MSICWADKSSKNTRATTTTTTTLHNEQNGTTKLTNHSNNLLIISSYNGGSLTKVSLEIFLCLLLGMLAKLGDTDNLTILRWSSIKTNYAFCLSHLSLSLSCLISQKNGLNGGQAITTWSSPTNSLKSNKPTTLDDDRDPDVIPSYHQYGNNK